MHHGNINLPDSAKRAVAPTHTALFCPQIYYNVIGTTEHGSSSQMPVIGLFSVPMSFSTYKRRDPDVLSKDQLDGLLPSSLQVQY